MEDLKGLKNQEAFATIESELLGVLKKKGRQGITTKNLMYQMKVSTATVYKHLNLNMSKGNVEKLGRGKWRLVPKPTPLLGPVDSAVVEQLFSHEGLVPCVIFEGENPKIPFHSMFEDMLAGCPGQWFDDKEERKNWVEAAVNQTYGQPKLLLFFPKNFAEMTHEDLDEELFFSDLPGLCDGLLYRMIEWNAKVKKLKLDSPSSLEQRGSWLKQALDFDFLFVMRIDGRKIAAQFQQQTGRSKPL